MAVFPLLPLFPMPCLEVLSIQLFPLGSRILSPLALSFWDGNSTTGYRVLPPLTGSLNPVHIFIRSYLLSAGPPQLGKISKERRLC